MKKVTSQINHKLTDHNKHIYKNKSRVALFALSFIAVPSVVISFFIEDGEKKAATMGFGILLVSIFGGLYWLMRKWSK